MITIHGYTSLKRRGVFCEKNIAEVNDPHSGPIASLQPNSREDSHVAMTVDFFSPPDRVKGGFKVCLECWELAQPKIALFKLGDLNA